MAILIESERIYLRNIEMTDADDMYELDSDPKVHKYLGNNPVTSMEKTREIIKDIHCQYERNNLGRSAIIEKSTGDFIGWAGLKIEDKIRDFTYCDIGYRLKSKHWYKGFGTEAALLSLSYGFETRGFDKICGAADIANVGSNKILSRIGLERIETFVFKETTCNWYALSREAYLESN